MCLDLGPGFNGLILALVERWMAKMVSETTSNLFLAIPID